MSQRNFNMSDADMCQNSRTKRQHFIDNKPAFVDFDLDFDGTFDADWLAAIEAAEGVQTAETRGDVLQQESDDVKLAMRNGRKKIAEVKFFAEKAFPGKVNILGELGFNNYTATTKTQQGMIAFLTSLHKIVNEKYNANFLAVNFNQTKIDSILTVKNALATEDTEQNTFAETSPQDTDARIGVLNTAFGFWQKVNGASKAIYYDDPIKLNLFLFPRGTEAEEVIKVQGTARHSVTNELLPGVSVSIPSLGITVITDSNAQYVIGGVDGGTYDMQFSKTNFQVNTQLGIVVPLDGSVVVDVFMVPL